MFYPLHCCIKLVTYCLLAGTQFQCYFSYRQVFNPVHVKDFFHAFRQAIDGLHELLFCFFEVEFFVSGLGVVVFCHLLEGVYVLLVEVLIAHSVEEFMFEGGTQVGENGCNRGKGSMFFPEMYEHTLDRVLRGGWITGDAAGVGEEVVPVQLKELTESVFIT